MDLASRRILRMTLGTALGMWISQAIGWPMSFVAPLLAFVFLSLPLPRPSIKMTVEFVVVLGTCSFSGVLLLPFLDHARWAGILMFVLALFYSFYYTARGGSAALGTFMTVGLTLVAAIGSVSSEAMVLIAQAFTVNGIIGMGFVWMAHAIVPDPPPDPKMVRKRPQKPAPPELHTARLRALRSMLVVLPIAIFFLFSSASAGYVVIMIKVASMGQEANVDSSRSAGRSMLASTVVGGVGAIVAWQMLSIWPSLLMYSLLLALFLLLFGPKIFQGAGMHPKAPMWSYGFLTMIVVLAPAVTDGIGSDGASAAFYTRLILFVVIAIYGSIAIAVFDAFWPRVTGGSGRRQPEPEPA